MSYRPMPDRPTEGAYAPAPASAPHGPATDLLGRPGFPQACFMTCKNPYPCLWFGCSIRLSHDTIARQLEQFPKSAYVAPDWDPA
jgi:hypothetical protein